MYHDTDMNEVSRPGGGSNWSARISHFFQRSIPRSRLRYQSKDTPPLSNQGDTPPLSNQGSTEHLHASIVNYDPVEAASFRLDEQKDHRGSRKPRARHTVAALADQDSPDDRPLDASCSHDHPPTSLEKLSSLFGYQRAQLDDQQQEIDDLRSELADQKQFFQLRLANAQKYIDSQAENLKDQQKATEELCKHHMRQEEKLFQQKDVVNEWKVKIRTTWQRQQELQALVKQRDEEIMEKDTLLQRKDEEIEELKKQLNAS